MKTQFVSTGAITVALSLLLGTPFVHADQPKLAEPSAEQLAFADMELGAFYHFGMSTFTGEVHGLGRGKPSAFNPARLDTRQWLSGAVGLRAKYATLTARHEDGFCLWPTDTTDYSVKNAPWKHGKGDVVGDFVAACREVGIAPCLYYSPAFDAHHLFKATDKPRWGEWNIPKYWDRMSKEEFAAFKERELAQVTELLRRYRPAYIWCDHNLAGAPSAPRMQELMRAVTSRIMELDPKCLVHGPHTWGTGSERGSVVYPLWNAVNTVDGTLLTRPRVTRKNTNATSEFGLLETGVNTGHPFGRFWRPRESVTDRPFGSGRWFWNDNSIRGVQSGEQLVDEFYYRTVGFGANLMINFAPNKSGLVPDVQIINARAFGEALAKRFAKPVGQTADVSVGDTVTVSWEKPSAVREVVLMENIVHGQKVASYQLEAWVNNSWQALIPRNAPGFRSRKPAGYETIGHKKIDRVAPVTTTKVRFRCLKAVAKPVEIRSMKVFGE